MKKVIKNLLNEEASEIEKYFERYNSLRELALVFESDEVFSKNSLMYKKLVDDISYTKKSLSQWWEKIILKYNLQDYDRERMYVDFVKGEIHYS